MNKEKFQIYKNYILELQYRYTKDQVSAMATKLTFYTVLSTFPFIIVFLEILRISNISDTTLFLSFADLFPASVTGFVSYLFADAEANKSGSILPFATVIALWSSSRAINVIIQSLRVAYRVKEKRNFIIMRIMAFGYTIAFVVIVFLTIGLIVFGNRIYLLTMTYVEVPFNIELIVDLGRYILTFLLSIIFFNGMYNIVPIPGHKIKSAFPGTIVATIGWVTTSYFFSLYANMSSSLSYIYGSLADIVIVLLWLYVCSIFIMLGGEVNAVIGHFKEKNKADSECLL